MSKRKIQPSKRKFQPSKPVMQARRGITTSALACLDKTNRALDAASFAEEARSIVDPPVLYEPKSTPNLYPAQGSWTTCLSVKGSDSPPMKLTGWDSVASQFNEGGSFTRVQKSSEVKDDYVGGFTGANNGSGDDATPMRERLIQGEQHVFTSGKGTSKSDRNENTFMGKPGTTRGSLAPLMAGRRDGIIPDGITLGWRFQNTTVKCWR